MTFREIFGVTSTLPVTTAFTLQEPDSQVLVKPHLCPQEPQLEVSVLRFVQPPPQQVAVSPEQIWPQEPQFPLLVVRLTQDPSHFVNPRTAQLRVKPPGVTVLSPVTVDVGVVVVAGVVVTGAVVDSVGTFEHVDALQIMPAGHWFPQMPQLSALDESS